MQPLAIIHEKSYAEAKMMLNKEELATATPGLIKLLNVPGCKDCQCFVYNCSYALPLNSVKNKLKNTAK